MSYVIAAPEMMTAAAADLATVGENVNAAHMAATASTVAVTPAAADEVSAAIASVFSGHAQAYQGLAGQAAAFHDHFVASLKTGAGSYLGAEAAAAAPLQHVTAPAAVTPAVLNSDVSVLLADPLLIPIILFVLGFIGLVAIYIVVGNLLMKFGLLPVPS